MVRILSHVCSILGLIVITLCYKIDKKIEINRQILYINTAAKYERYYNGKRKKELSYFQKIINGKNAYKEIGVTRGGGESRKTEETWKQMEKNKKKEFKVCSSYNEENKADATETSNICNQQKIEQTNEQTNKNALSGIKSTYIHTIMNLESQQKKKEDEKKKLLRYSIEQEKQLREKIEKERKTREETHKSNNIFLNTHYKYTSNFLPINVEKKYVYENFKYSEEIVLYIFFIINLFKHEQFKNKIYKDFLEKEKEKADKDDTNEEGVKEVENEVENEVEKEDMDEDVDEDVNEDVDEDDGNNIVHRTEQRNRKIVNAVISRFGERFAFFNPSERIQGEDWAHIFKLEKDDKTRFFENIKVKGEKKKEYFMLIYYCNWQYACMALYNALHNIFHNMYNNIHFYNMWEKEEEEQLGTNKKGEEVSKITNSEIEQIKEMYIKDLENQVPLDIDSLLKKDQQFFSSEGEDGTDKEEEEETKEETEKTEKKEEKVQNGMSKHEKEDTEKGNKFQDKGKTETTKPGGESKKKWQEIMEEEKKKLDEEYFLHGYSQYENEEEIKKEEEEIKETKQIIEEEKKNKTGLNQKQDLKNIYKDFYLKLNSYKKFYQWVKTKKPKESKVEEKSHVNELTQQREINENKGETEKHRTDEENYREKDKTEVNVNVIFVRISNSTVIGKTKNIKEKIKKKWIYCHQKEIKFYELILSAMLNENIYYKDIPHVELFTVNYDTTKMYEFFNSLNTNLKHSFIHKNKVYDVFNNHVNGPMDVYNFNIDDRSKFVQEKSKERQHNTDLQKKQKEDVKWEKQLENNVVWQDEDVVIEEIGPSGEIEEESNYQVAFDQQSEMLNDTNLNDEVEKKFEGPIEKKTVKENNENNENEENKENKKVKKKADTYSNCDHTINKKKHNKKERSKYEPLFKQKYSNIFVNKLKDKLQIEQVASISNFDTYANVTTDTFKDLSLSEFLRKNKFKKNTQENNFYVDNNHIYYHNQKIPKDLFPFLLHLSMAFKFEHTTLLINAPKKIVFEFRNV